MTGQKHRAVASTALAFISILILCYFTCSIHSDYTGWPEKNVVNFRMALCNRVDETNQKKSMYVMSKHLRICL